MSILTIKDVFDDLSEDIKFNKSDVIKINNLCVNFVTKNNDHRSFFGGKLIGLYVIRFTLSDESEFFDTMFNIDVGSAKKMAAKITTINQTFKVSSDAMNLAVMYIVHRFLTSPHLDNEGRYLGAKLALLYMNYRTLATFNSNYFIYPLDENTAQSLYEALSGRYLIKKYNNWREVTEHRVVEMLKPSNHQIDTLIKFTEDDKIVNIINDVVNRVKDNMKNIYREFRNLPKNNKKLKSSQATMMDVDGDVVIKDLIGGPLAIGDYLKTTLVDKDSFIKGDLVAVIASSMEGASEELLLDTLEGFFLLHKDLKHKKTFDTFIDIVITAMVGYLRKIDYVIKKHNDMRFIVTKLRGFILSSRSSTDITGINDIRDVGIDIVRESLGGEIKYERTLSSLRNMLVLYIILRALSKEHW